MAVYELNKNYNDNNDAVLDNMLEAVMTMKNSIDESTAVQRYYTGTSKEFKDANSPLSKSKIAANIAAADAAKMFHGKDSDNAEKNYEKAQDKTNISSSGAPASTKEKEDYIKNATAKAMMGARLAKYAKESGANVKASYDKAAEKEEKKKAVKETCLYILSAIDEL